MADIKNLDRELLNEVFEYQKNYLKSHKDCKVGINFPDGSHTCKAIERATAQHFKQMYNQNLSIKLQILGLE